MLLAADDRDGAAEAELLLAAWMWQRADGDMVLRHLSRAVELMGSSPPSPTKARVLSAVSRYHMLAGRNVEAVSAGEEALSMASHFGLEEIRAQALINIGSAKADQGGGEQSGHEELRLAIEIAKEAHAIAELFRGYNNLGASCGGFGDYRGSVSAWLPGLELVDRYRGLPSAEYLRGHRLTMAFVEGHWDELERLAAEFFAENDPAEYRSAAVHEMLARVRLGRGNLESAFKEADLSLAIGRRAQDPQRLQPALAAMATTMLASGRIDECNRCIDELLELDPFRVGSLTVFGVVLELAWVMSGVGRSDEYLRAAATTGRQSRWLEAGTAFARDDVVRSAEICVLIGMPACEAFARLLAGRSLSGQGKRDQAVAQLRMAIDLYRPMGATAYVEETERSITGSAAIPTVRPT
jgi:tetratricopeptide (TPR) repeat protein